VTAVIKLFESLKISSTVGSQAWLSIRGDGERTLRDVAASSVKFWSGARSDHRKFLHMRCENGAQSIG
jgi:hypothetical protein